MVRSRVQVLRFFKWLRLEPCPPCSPAPKPTFFTTWTPLFSFWEPLGPPALPHTSPHPSGVTAIWNLIPGRPAKKINGNHVLCISGCSHLRPPHPGFRAETDPPKTGKPCPWAGAQVLTGPLSPGKPLASSCSSNAFQPRGGERWPALAAAINS